MTGALAPFYLVEYIVSCFIYCYAECPFVEFRGTVNLV
jgi:hypothetical protein